MENLGIIPEKRRPRKSIKAEAGISDRVGP